MAEETDADRLLREVFEKDTTKRLQAGVDLLNYLQDEANSIFDFDQVDKLVEGLTSWVHSSNPKICSNGLELLAVVVDRLSDKFRPHLSIVLPALRERLGDARQQVRDSAMDLIMELMSSVANPQAILDRLLPEALAHKGWHVREQGLLCIAKALNKFGKSAFLVSRHMGTICKLTGDANFQVRDQAVLTLVEIYRHVGEKLRVDLGKHDIPSSRLNALNAKFDEVRASGSMMPTAAGDEIYVSGDDSRPPSRGPSVSNLPTASRGMPRSSSSLSNESGAIDEDDFERGFEDCPVVRLASAKEVQEEIVKVEETLSKSSLAWEVRVASLKRLRGLLNAGASDHDVFQQHLTVMRNPFSTAVKDLRSSVTREACITISLMAAKIGNRLEHFAASLLPPLFLLLPNSAKVMATSGNICIKYLIRYVHSPRLIPPFSKEISSKSAVVRRRMAEYFDRILHSWDGHPLERHVDLLYEAVHKGIHDADSGARTAARHAYWGFAQHFPLQAQKLHNSLDASRQRMLADEYPTRGTASKLPTSRPPLPPSSGSSGSSGLRRFTSEPDLSPSLPRANRAEVGAQQPMKRSATAGEGLSGLMKSSSMTPQRPAVTTAGASQTTSNSVVSSTPGHRLDMQATPASSSKGSVPSVGAPVSRAKTPSRGPVSLKLGAPRTPAARSNVSSLPRPKTPSSRRQGRSASDSAALDIASAGVEIPEPSPESMKAVQEILAKQGFSSSHLPLMARQDDDDNQSLCSDVSHTSTFSVQSMSGRIHLVEDIREIIRLCQSGVWSDRRDGVASLRELLQSPSTLSKAEVSKLQEVFYKMFMDPHNTVLSLFLDTFMEFIIQYRTDLHSWLKTALQRLLQKHSSEVRSSIIRKLDRILELIRDLFEVSLQLSALFFIISDTPHPATLKVKLQVLKYLQHLLPRMEANDLSNVPETRQGVRKLVDLSAEPKSVEIRRLSTRIIAQLYQLNRTAFGAIIAALPRNSKDSTNKILHGQGLSATPSGNRSTTPDRLPTRTTPGRTLSASLSMSNLQSMSASISVSSPDLRHTGGSRIRPPSSSGRTTPTGRTVPSGRTTPGLRTTSPSVKSQLATPAKRVAGQGTPTGARTRQPSGDQQSSKLATSQGPPSKPTTLAFGKSMPDVSIHSPSDGGSLIISPTEIVSPPEKPLVRVLDPELAAVAITDQISGKAVEEDVNGETANMPSPGAGFVNEGESPSPVQLLLDTVMGSVSISDRLTALESLGELAIEDEVTLWDANFHLVLMKTLQLLDSQVVEMRIGALQFLRQLVSFQSTRFVDDYVELCLRRILHVYSDAHAEVVRQVEDMLPVISSTLPAEIIINISLPIVARQEFPQLICCLKWLTKVIGRLSKEELQPQLKKIVPALVKTYGHSDSSVRKASVFCLVAAHATVGDDLMSHLSSLTGSQMKLLNLYIKRSKE